MSTEEDVKKAADEATPDEAGTGPDDEAHQKVADLALVGETPAAVTDEVDREVQEELGTERDTDEVASAGQLGTRRFVYAAYFAGAIAVAFLVSKFGGLIWMRLAAWKPQVGEPREDIILPISAIIGAATAFYYWRQPKTRQYTEEVASELSQVTWPSRKEVTNSTTVVIVTTAFATIFFALMDRFWGFVTNLVYGT